MSTSSSPRPNLIKGLFFAFVGVVLLFISGYIAVDRHEFLSHAQKAPGVVKSLNAGGSHPQIEFTSSSGKVVSYPQGGMIFGYQTGQAVEVYYREEDPALTPQINDFGALWGSAALVGLIGLGFLLGGADEIFSRRKKPVAPSPKGI